MKICLFTLIIFIVLCDASNEPNDVLRVVKVREHQLVDQNHQIRGNDHPDPISQNNRDQNIHADGHEAHNHKQKQIDRAGSFHLQNFSQNPKYRIYGADHKNEQIDVSDAREGVGEPLLSVQLEDVVNVIPVYDVEGVAEGPQLAEVAEDYEEP